VKDDDRKAIELAVLNTTKFIEANSCNFFAVVVCFMGSKLTTKGEVKEFSKMFQKLDIDRYDNFGFDTQVMVDWDIKIFEMR